MNIGKILSLPTALGLQKQERATDREPGQGGSYSNSGNERQGNPTEDDAKSALEILSKLDSISSSGLKLELQAIEGNFSISVKDQSGQVLRVLRGSDIFRLIDMSKESNDSNRRGRILDSRL